MKDVRATVMNILDRLPPDATLEDVIYHLYVQSKIYKGLADADAGRLIDDEEVERRITRWLHEAHETPKTGLTHAPADVYDKDRCDEGTAPERRADDLLGLFIRVRRRGANLATPRTPLPAGFA